MWQLPYSVNKIGHILIPHRHRKPRFVAWVKVFLACLVKVKEDLYQYWDETITDASMTPQIIYLERLLNSMFDSTEIFISNDYENLGPWIFLNTETADPEFYMSDDVETDVDAYVYNNLDAVWVDFTVNIPEALHDNIPLIAAIVQKYKLPGKYFIIQIYS